MSAENCALSQRWFEEVWNERRTATIVELMSPDGIGHMESGDLRGVEPFKLVRDEFIAAVPDLKFAIEGIVADGDDVVVRWCASGTHSGEGLGIEPTQQQLVVRGMTWQRFKDGVLVEGWDGWNQEALFQRLREGTDEKRKGDLEKRQKLSARLREIREELFGEHGGPEMARRLNIPARTWYNFETGVTVPADVLLDFLNQTGVDPHWLLTGEEPKYRRDKDVTGLSPIDLLRRVLDKLEHGSRDAGGGAENRAPQANADQRHQHFRTTARFIVTDSCRARFLKIVASFHPGQRPDVKRVKLAELLHRDGDPNEAHLRITSRAASSTTTGD